jgi:hypothetical protein
VDESGSGGFSEVTVTALDVEIGAGMYFYSGGAGKFICADSRQ